MKKQEETLSEQQSREERVSKIAKLRQIAEDHPKVDIFADPNLQKIIADPNITIDGYDEATATIKFSIKDGADIELNDTVVVDPNYVTELQEQLSELDLKNEIDSNLLNVILPIFSYVKDGTVFCGPTQPLGFQLKPNTVLAGLPISIKAEKINPKDLEPTEFTNFLEDNPDYQSVFYGSGSLPAILEQKTLTPGKDYVLPLYVTKNELTLLGIQVDFFPDAGYDQVAQAIGKMLELELNQPHNQEDEKQRIAYLIRQRIFSYEHVLEPKISGWMYPSTLPDAPMAAIEFTKAVNSMILLGYLSIHKTNENHIEFTDACLLHPETNQWLPVSKVKDAWKSDVQILNIWKPYTQFLINNGLLANSDEEK